MCPRQWGTWPDREVTQNGLVLASSTSPNNAPAEGSSAMAHTGPLSLTTRKCPKAANASAQEMATYHGALGRPRSSTKTCPPLSPACSRSAHPMGSTRSVTGSQAVCLRRAGSGVKQLAWTGAPTARTNPICAQHERE